MGVYAPPMALGSVVTSPDQISDSVILSQHVVNLSADKLTAGTIDASKITVINLNASNITSGTISGLTINGGQSFSDTLGTFYPIVINPAGNVTVNSSDNHTTSIVFHNTKTSLTDTVLSNRTISGGQYLAHYPNTSSLAALVTSVWDRNDPTAAYGFDFLASGTATGIFKRYAGTQTQIYAANGDAWLVGGIAGLGSSSNLGVSALSHMTVNAQYFSPSVTDTFGSTTTTNLDLGNVHVITLTGNITTWTITNPQAGGRYIFILAQDGTGGRTIAWPAAFKWVGGTAPTFTTTASHVDLVSAVYHGGNYYATIAQNYG